MTGECRDLAEELQTWALKEMHFYSHGHTGGKLPTLDDFRVLCRGPSAAIWKWVTTHVHSAEDTHFLKSVTSSCGLCSEWQKGLKECEDCQGKPGAICTVDYLKFIVSNQKEEPISIQRVQSRCLYSQVCKRNAHHTKYKVRYNSEEKFGEEKNKLLEERSELTGEITSVLRDIGHLETELDRLSHDLAETENEYEKQVSTMRDIRRKTALIQAYSKKTEDSGAQYSEYTKCINNRLNTTRQLAQKSFEPEEFYSRETDVHLGETTDNAALETACCKNVRECCESIGGFLNETLKGTFGTDKTEFSRRKEPIWQQVETVTSTYSPDQILSSLLTNTQMSTLATKDMTSRVDIRRDAQNLRFKYEPNGEISDLSAPPSLLRSVHQILQDRNSEYFQRYIACQKYTNDVKNLEQVLNNIRLQIDKRLQKLFGQKNKDLQVARTLIEAEIELEGYRCALHCLTTETEKLKDMVQRSYKERQELYTKHHKIQEFKDLTDKKQNLIQVLVKQNINSQSRLDAQIAEIVQYIGRSLQSHKNQIEAVTSQLSNCVDKEVHQFASLSLPYLMFSNIDNALKTAVIDLSIHHTHPSYIRESLATVLQCLNFPSFQSPDTMLQSCLQLKCDIEDIVDQLEREKWVLEWKKRKEGGKDIANVITELCAAVQEQDQKQLHKSLPLLQHKLSKTGSAMSDCLHTKDYALAWWNQPGQHCVPWVTVDGHNLQHYLDRWTVLATSLRQKLVK